MTDRELYLDYVNNFISTKGFADHYDLTITEASDIIAAGRRNYPLTPMQMLLEEIAEYQPKRGRIPKAVKEHFINLEKKALIEAYDSGKRAETGADYYTQTFR